MHERIIVLAALLGACTSTYHPEYHPVTVTTVQQTTNAPVEVETNRPVVVAPAASAPPIVVPAPALADPNVVFR